MRHTVHKQQNWVLNSGQQTPKLKLFTTKLPGGSDGKASARNAGDPGSIPGLGRSPREGSGNPLQYSCLENPWTEEPGGLPFIGLQRVGHN